MDKSNIVITIDRQIGSGGKYLGKRLTENLNFSYYDKEIVRDAAKDLHASIEEIESSDEKQGGILKNVLSYSTGAFGYYPEVEIIRDDKAHKAQANVIIKVANEKSVVIIGRAASYLLRNHPRHISIFLHADLDFRKKRTQQLNNISGDKVLQLLEKTDKQRLKYYKVFTGMDMYNACTYDLTINTSKLGLKKSEAIIMQYLKERFGDELLNSK
ncbi:cytidylate kinase-like family protein [Clostridium estertheticum]|uniref:cytidylate kinase-like family protein n=1 Tax=Clostridium estertheticum TaxID=238834 RepID=UPI001C0D6017|nr:cytidylate kinase-like family protein [Clostridium estertheticum]MBU3178361.1 cytidylate kinase-like family protein [Clostridium estertheticum]